MTTSHAITGADRHPLRSALRSVRLVLPAGSRARKKILAGTVSAHGLDLSDDDRARRILARHGR